MTKDEILIDEAARESFPASDPPAWTAMHAGLRSQVARRSETPRELRALLRFHVEALTLESPQHLHAVVEHVTTAFVDTGRHVIRSPLLARPGVENVETVIRGAEAGGEVVLCTRYEGDGDVVSGLTVLLGLAHVLAGQRFERTVRLIAFADSGGQQYAQRLHEQGIHVAAVVSLDSVGFLPDRNEHTSLPFPLRTLARHLLAATSEGELLTFVADRSSRALAEEACIAFGTASTLEARALTLPSVMPLVSSSDQHVFARGGFPSVLLSDTAPLRTSRRRPRADLPRALSYDAMADVVFGLAAVVMRLAGNA